MPNAPTTPVSGKQTYWIPVSLHEEVKAFVDRRRNAPHFMSINRFVREALEEKLARGRRK